jgi:lysyl-tRNA synthetase class 2
MSGSDWRPLAPLPALRQRARLYQHIRAFFEARDVMEVSTPVLGRHGVTDPAIQCIQVPGHGVLQSSPEYHMKRLLAAGSGAIYQISPVFREGESGARHNTEFTLLEWYRPGFSLPRLIDETCALMAPLLGQPPVKRVSFRALFKAVTGLDPLSADMASLQQAIPAGQHVPDMDRPQLVDWLMGFVVEPAMDRDTLVVVQDFPAWAAALARLQTDPEGDTVAARFEIYFNGLELANGYDELTDPAEQRARFEADRARRTALGLPDASVDPHLLAALEHGIGDCAGVALGVERLLMAASGEQRIDRVMAFTRDNA